MTADSDATTRLLVRCIAAAFPLHGAPQPLAVKSIPLHSWPPLTDCALRHSLAAMLYSAFPGLEQEDLSETARQRLEEIYYRTKFANAAAHRLLAQLLGAFDAHGVPVMVLKGAALSLYLYPDAALRPFGDIDLLIPRAQLEHAHAVLEEQGLQTTVERGENFDTEFLKGKNYARAGALPISVDLHWHLLAPTYYRRTVPVDWFWQQTTTFDCFGQTARTLNPGAQLLYLAAHAAVHHPGIRLIQLYDIARLITRYRATLDWEWVVTHAARLNLAPPIALTLHRSVEWWGADVPAETLTQLEQVKTPFQARTVFALASAPNSAARSLADAMYQPSAGNKLRFALGYVFPSYEYMRVRYPLKHRAQLPLYYVRRSTDISRLLAQSLAAAARNYFHRRNQRGRGNPP